ncbi:hypothetical protein QFC24_005324 [Naganishia onofrii]|uniref:Uncharacterized protein n=1 Tax=Naganishia onofrii TaxID=1851511 RepID=A0ACC2X8L1_9TREE|nr:hypothetical protein QFC24_005324 [Naganishia onofrii]
MSFKPAKKVWKGSRPDASNPDVSGDDLLALFGASPAGVPMVNSFTLAGTSGDDPFLLAAVGQNDKPPVIWLFDTGASDHVCNDRTAFESFGPLDKPQVYHTVSSDIRITEGGTVRMALEGGSQLLLSNVQYYAPAPANLLSWGVLRE